MSENASIITPPRSRNSKRNLWMVAVTTSSVRKPVDPDMRMRWVRLRAEGGIVDFVFLPSDAGTVDNALTGDQTSASNLGWRLADGEHQDFQLGGDDLFIAVQGSANCSLRVLGSGPKRIKDGASEGP